MRGTPVAQPERIMKSLSSSFWLTVLASFMISSCQVQLEECSGTQVNTEKLLQIQDNRFLGGDLTSLVLPNPIDSARSNFRTFSSSTFLGAQQPVGLPDIKSNSALENSFLKVRLHTRFDSENGIELAGPSDIKSKSDDVKDPVYSQAMAYHAITSIMEYVKELGFGIDKSRPLYVFVRSSENPDDKNSKTDIKDINAYYVHNANQNKSRYIQLFGDVEYPLGADRDVFWHEFGHLFNESLTADRGIDSATVEGALYMEGGAIHECLADYLSQSASKKGYIGRWAALNLPDFKPGQPLRSALYVNDEKNNFSSVSTFSPSQGVPDKYSVAEWCSRVLWDIRTQFEKEDPKSGALFSDKVIFSAASLLGKNTTFSELRSAIAQADKQLHCGLHQASIDKAFSVRGFKGPGTRLPKSLVFRAEPVQFDEEITFKFALSNPNGATARNVRLEIQNIDPAIVPLTELQGFGDLKGGQSLSVSGRKLEELSGSVSFTLDKRFFGSRKKVKVVLRVSAENAPDFLYPVEVSLYE